VASACGTEPTTDASSAATTAGDSGGIAPGVATITASEAAATLADAPDDLVLLDVRTPEEFADGHLDGAVLVDFYDPDFADRLAELDRDVPYLVYCRSGNRSGETLALMEQLGFDSVRDVGGGILAWADAGLPVVTD
jgi:rhodanese-related sulfurtransferase